MDAKETIIEGFRKQTKGHSALQNTTRAGIRYFTDLGSDEVRRAVTELVGEGKLVAMKYPDDMSSVYTLPAAEKLSIRAGVVEDLLRNSSDKVKENQIAGVTGLPIEIVRECLKYLEEKGTVQTAGFEQTVANTYYKIREVSNEKSSLCPD